MLRTPAFAAGFLLLGVVVAVAQEPLQHSKDSLDTVKESLKTGKAILLDVREQSEWDAGHLKAARLIPQSNFHKEATLAELIRTLPKDKVIYTHCRAGTRALDCGEILKKHGFDAHPLKTGYQGLVDAGFEKAADKK